MNTNAYSDSYALAIEKPGAIFTGTRRELKETVIELRQLGLLPLIATSEEAAI